MIISRTSPLCRDEHASLVSYAKLHSEFELFITVEPPNKGHFGNDINSAVLSLIERLSSGHGSQ